MDKITYKCRNCGWNKSIAAQWSDSKPSFCANKKCDYSAAKAQRTKKSFRNTPGMLEIIKPTKPKPPPVHVPVSKKAEKVVNNQEELAKERKKKRRGHTPENE